MEVGCWIGARPHPATYDPVPDTIRVGDAFTRTITATVDDALATVVPPMGADSISGMAVYADPLVDDRGGSNRRDANGSCVSFCVS